MTIVSDRLTPGFGLERCQGCGRTEVVWRYAADGTLEACCRLCYHVHRGALAQQMLDFRRLQHFPVEFLPPA